MNRCLFNSIARFTSASQQQQQLVRRSLSYSCQGITVPPFTPLKSNGDVNYALVPTYAEYLRKQGAESVFLLGSTGEGTSLTIDERKRVLESWMTCRENGTIARVSVHIGALCLRDVQELAAHAESVGVDAISSLPALYYRPANVDRLLDYVAEMCSAAPQTPFLLYDHPATTGLKLDMREFLRRGADRVAQLNGVKYSDADLHVARDANEIDPARFTVFWCRDEGLLPALACGMHSFIGVSYNFTTALAQRLIADFGEGKIDSARRIQSAISRVYATCLKVGEPFNTMKVVSSMRSGIELGPTRSPLLTIAGSTADKLNRDVDAILAEI